MEKCVLVGLKTPKNKHNFQNSFEELERLAQTAGTEIIETFIQEKPAPNPATFIGKGKITEIANFVNKQGIELIFFDHELTPTQQRNIEKETQVKVVDRTALILDIFAGHAQSRAGKLQVELAQYNYILPRLTRMWTHLSRMAGGIGTRRGPGETQLEVDRRRIKTRISHLKKDLVKVEKNRRTQRKQRQRTGIFKIVLVGYTNSGKSSLVNLLTKAGVKAEDKLFSTLDPTSRKIWLDGGSVVVTDTVGFIDNLPHELIEAFKSTLEEVTEADLMLKVTDASVEDIDERIKTVDFVLSQIGAEGQSLLVFNKIDLLNSDEKNGLKNRYPDAIFISVEKNIGIEDVKDAVSSETEL